MMKKLLSLLIALLLCMPCLPALAEEELTIVHVTDMHYLSPALTDYGEDFMALIAAADGKVTHYTPQIMQAFADEMLMLQPDAIILSGDLTLNGALQSHTELAALLTPLAESGIQVLALPGNHDANSSAYQFIGEMAYPIDGLDDEEFDDVYAALGYADAISRDETSMSYTVQLSPDVRCILLDVNANGTAGTVNPGTLIWLEEQLLSAQEAGNTVFTVTHQPVLRHNRLFSFGYEINNASKLMEVYEKHGVPLNLCGHLHMQHIKQSGALTEIAASSLAVSPHQYGVLRIQDGRLLDYAMQPLNVDAWAARTGQTDQQLLDFTHYSADFFKQTTWGQVLSMLEDMPISSDQQTMMADFAAQLNADYFAGMLTLTADHPAWALWESLAPDSFFTIYMDSILEESPKDMQRHTFAAE